MKHFTKTSIYLDIRPVPKDSDQPYTVCMVLIFGKAHCPYTQAALDHYEGKDVPVEYIDVKKSRADLDRMMGYSGGVRRVPVIVDEAGDVTIGWGGT